MVHKAAEDHADADCSGKITNMYRAYVQVVLVRQDHVCFKADHVRKLQLQQ